MTSVGCMWYLTCVSYILWDEACCAFVQNLTIVANVFSLVLSRAKAQSFKMCHHAINYKWNIVLVCDITILIKVIDKWPKVEGVSFIKTSRFMTRGCWCVNAVTLTVNIVTGNHRAASSSRRFWSNGLPGQVNRAGVQIYIPGWQPLPLWRSGWEHCCLRQSWVQQNLSTSNFSVFLSQSWTASAWKERMWSYQTPLVVPGVSNCIRLFMLVFPFHNWERFQWN